MTILGKILGRKKPAGAPLLPYQAALDRNDYVTALPLLQEAIRREDANAMMAFGLMLALGRGVERDPVEGMAWIRQSAVRGDLRGQLLLGTHLASGLNLARDDSEAAYWLYKAAQGGLVEAAQYLADLVLRNPKVVGEHFSHPEFMALVKKARRPAPAVH